MFQSRVNNFVGNFGVGNFAPPVPSPLRDSRFASPTPMAVQLAEIYQAAVTRAVEDHELDKLFNADFYDHQT